MTDRETPFADDSGTESRLTERSRRQFLRTSAAVGIGAGAVGATATGSAETVGGLSHSDHCESAVAVYNYLLDSFGEVILSGQQYEPGWASPDDELAYIEDVTGRRPALMGTDFIREDRSHPVRLARDWWDQGGIPTIMWHWGAPGTDPDLDEYERSQMAIDIGRCFEEGTAEYDEFWSELEAVADALEALRDDGVPVLWRPFHEFTGDWFWWSKGGAETFKRLWRTMYDYFVTERDLNNLVWVLCYSGNPKPDWTPDPQYYDVAGPDAYDVGRASSAGMFFETGNTVTRDVPIPFHECGTPPDPEACADDGAWWSWWMQWHTGHLDDTDDSYLDYVYDHDLVVTLDELPDIVSEYADGEYGGGEYPGDGCAPSNLDPYLQVDGGEWRNTAEVTIERGSTVRFGPHPYDTNGTWAWRGSGVSSNGREQSVSPDVTSTYTATYTNTCDDSASLEYAVTVEEDGVECAGAAPKSR